MKRGAEDVDDNASGGKRSCAACTRCEMAMGQCKCAALDVLEGRSVIFVGGKGGVGKTSVSCALALKLAHRRKKVLLISTDPAHNVSDCFKQQFSGKPQAVNGVDNLFAVESDPKVSLDKLFGQQQQSGSATATPPQADLISQMRQMLSETRDWLSSLPGVDEAMALVELLKGDASASEYDVLVVDTAPTGHTLKLLQLPAVLQKGIERLESWQGRLAQYISMATMFFSPQPQATPPEEQLRQALKRLKDNVETLGTMLTNKKDATFVCVGIAEALSVLETGRLIHSLDEAKVHSNLMVVNHLFPRAFLEVADDDTKGDDLKSKALQLCRSRAKIQQRYLLDLSEHSKTHRIIQVDELPFEPRGVENLEKFISSWKQ